MGWREFRGITEMFPNWIVLIVSQFRKFAKNHRILHLKWVNFVISIAYLNKTVFLKAYVISSFFNFPDGREDLTQRGALPLRCVSAWAEGAHSCSVLCTEERVEADTSMLTL